MSPNGQRQVGRNRMSDDQNAGHRPWQVLVPAMVTVNICQTLQFQLQMFQFWYTPPCVHIILSVMWHNMRVSNSGRTPFLKKPPIVCSLHPVSCMPISRMPKRLINSRLFKFFQMVCTRRNWQQLSVWTVRAHTRAVTSCRCCSCVRTNTPDPLTLNFQLALCSQALWNSYLFQIIASNSK